MEGTASMAAALNIAIAVICYQWAKSKGFNPVVWAIGGFFFNIFALIALGLLPKREDHLGSKGN